MKAIKLKREGNIYNFIRDNLPDGLILRETWDSYGSDIEIALKYKRKRFFDFYRTPKIAIIKNKSIELYQPQYYSDMERLCLAYEKQYPDEEITLKYWEDHD
jgi:hypothetical protein